MGRSLLPSRRIWHLLRRIALDERAALADVDRSLAELEAELLIEAALQQGLAPALAELLDSSDRSVPGRIRDATEDARFVRASSLRVLHRIGELLDPVVPWLTTKGLVVAHSYRKPDLRAFSDLDILVPGTELGAAFDRLEAGGFHNLNRNWGNYRRFGVAETPLTVPGLTIDLHWHVIGLESRRRAATVDVSAMIERRRRIAIGGVEVPTFDREDLLLHVALHAGQSGGTKLVWLRDVTELVRSEPPDWDEFVSRARASGLSARIGQVLDRARIVLHADIPQGVPEQLCSSSAVRIRRVVDVLDTGAGLPTRFLRGFPVAVSETTIPRTLRSGYRELRSRLEADPGWNVSDPDGPLYWGLETGGAGGKDEYVRFAATQR